MISNSDIENLLSKISNDLGGRWDFEYKAPIAPESGHGLDFEDDYVLGTFVCWSSGALDWTIHDIESEKEISIGHEKFETFYEIQNKITGTLDSVSRSS